MSIGEFKRWQWACIGLVLGLGISFWRGWNGRDGALTGRPTLDMTEFEQMLVKKSPSGQPLVKDIRYFGREEGTDWVIAQQLVRTGRDATAPAYIPVKAAFPIPYVPKVNPPAKPDPNFTVIDYLKSQRVINPEVRFSTRWWDQEPVRSPLFAILGMAVMAGACPPLVNLLVGGSGVRTNKKKDSEYDLSRFGKGKHDSPKAARRGPTEADLAHVRELDDELEKRLAAKAQGVEPVDPSSSDTAHGTVHGASAIQSPQPIRKLDAGPLEAPAQPQAPKPQKKYGGDYYPTETHVKKDET